MSLTCSHCLEELLTYEHVGYDGPEEKGLDECNPFVPWLILCRLCARKTGREDQTQCPST